MLWRGIEVGPRLARGDREVRVGLDARTGATLQLRWFARVPAGVELPAVPWPTEPAANLARPLRCERSGSGVLVGSELALGPTLDLLFGSPQRLAVVAGLTAQLLTGLEVMHRGGRAHGRIHPGNLILDVHAGCLRIVNLWAGAFEGVPRGAEPQKLYVRPGAAQRGPSPGDDLYAAGRIAEALVRGGPPLGAWAPLEAPPHEPADRFARLSAWIERCQSLDAARAFGDSGEALAALKALGAEGEQSVAQVRSGSWVSARRRAERAVGRWRRRPPAPRQGPPEFEELLSSLRASWLWRRIGAAAGGAVVLSALVASKPHLPTALGSDWSEEACLEDAKPHPLAPGESPGPGAGVILQLQGGGASAVAIDGCPVGLPSPSPVRWVVAPGRHELRAKVAVGVAAESFLAGPGATTLDVDKLPIATSSGAAGAKDVQDRLKKIIAQLAAGGELPPADTLQRSLLNPAVAAVLDIDAKLVAESPATRAALPDDLALDLDALRAAAHRFDASAQPCTERFESLVTTALHLRQPEAPPLLQHAATLLAAARLEDEAGQGEAAIRARLGVAESPMLNATVDQVAGDDKLTACVAALKAPAATLTELTEHCLAQLEGPIALIVPEPESSGGSVP